MNIFLPAVSLALIVSILCSGACRSQSAPQQGAQAPAGESQASGSAASSAAPVQDDRAPDRLAAVLRGQFDDENVDAAIEALARSGVRVYTDDGARVVREVIGRPAALKFFRQQVRNMALLAAHGTGTPSQDLNAFVPAIRLGDRSLPISAVLAAYLVKGETFGAKLSRNLVGPVSIAQHAEITWPALTLALFVADAVPPPPAQKAAWLFPVVHAAETSGPCAVANDFLNSAGQRAVDAIAGPPTGGESDFLFGIIGAAADAVFGIAVSAARELISEATGLATVQKAMFAINLIATAQALFEQWTVTVVAEPAQIGAINHGSRNEGRFRATVEGGEGIAWPGAIQDCAKLLGMSLPGSPSAPGSKATWLPLVGFGPNVVETRRDTEISPDNTATFSYKAVKREDAALHSSGGAVSREQFQVLLTVENSARESVREFLTKVHAVIGDFVPAGAAAAVFNRLMAPWDVGVGELEFHKARPATASFARDAVALRAYTCTAPAGPWNYTVTHAAGGAAQGTFSVPGSYSWSMRMMVGAMTVSGTVAVDGDALVFSGATAARVPGGAGGSADSFRAPIVYGDVPECRGR